MLLVRLSVSCLTLSVTLRVCESVCLSVYYMSICLFVCLLQLNHLHLGCPGGSVMVSISWCHQQGLVLIPSENLTTKRFLQFPSNGLQCDFFIYLRLDSPRFDCRCGLCIAGGLSSRLCLLAWFLSVCLSLYPSIHLLASSLTHLPSCLSTCPSVWSVSAYIVWIGFLFISWSVHPSTCFPTYVSST